MVLIRNTFDGDNMSGPLKFTGKKNGRGRGLIQLYILHSLNSEPKSGYELLKEISAKTKGAWVPSKGTLYPMLKKMEDEGLTELSETGQRGKNIYRLTPEGVRMLEDIVNRKREERKKMYVFRDLLFEIFGEGNVPYMADMHELHFLADKIPDEKQDEAALLIKKCLDELRRIVPDDSSEC
ncbi:PadR family transcriptional regulator [Methanoplanus limicola]|uniref:Transcriptional regulator, PadR family n=1 Tax=Methanoplanus limicola DSM 2279 TaxID=937775 RepID=H1YZK5_9EURY|nr:PadR family transcriptional regulator [Methanoplanus limicola]EHQ36114.1 transcriptional regulator, PadR family [Methanoplanus limicola DSM 2279]